MTEATQVPVPATTEGPGPVWLALRVLDEPTRVFKALVAKPRALVPILILVVVAAASVMSIPSSIMVAATEQRLQALEQQRPGSVTPELRERAIKQATNGTSKYIGGAAAAAGSLITLLVVSAVLMLVFNAMSGASVRFKEEWAIAAHAWMPQVIGSIVTVAAISMLGDPDFRVSLGFLVSTDHKFLHSLANQVTFFGAWTVYLLALGNQVRTRDKSISGALAIVGGLWMSVNAIGAILASAFSGVLG
jgi:hypothetical protein